MDKARIRDLEKLYSAALHEIDALEEQCATAEDEIYELIQDRMKIQAQAAAMRDFVEGVLRDCEAWDTGNFDAEDIISTLLDITPQVLAPDAGKKLLERLAKAEAELSLTKFCNTDADEHINLLEDQMVLLAEKLKKAEAERVEEYPHRAFCADSRCGWWMIGATEHCIDCTAYRFHQYLKTNHMIREAE